MLQSGRVKHADELILRGSMMLIVSARASTCMGSVYVFFAIGQNVNNNRSVTDTEFGPEHKKGQMHTVFFLQIIIHMSNNLKIVISICNTGCPKKSISFEIKIFQCLSIQ